MDNQQHPAATVVTLPAEIDFLNAEYVRGLLTAALAADATAVIADLTATTFCDTAGLKAMILAHQAAAAGGAVLHLAIPGPLARIFTLAGLDRFLATYPTLTAARAALTAPTAAPPG